jgi:hypothetical protein
MITIVSTKKYREIDKWLVYDLFDELINFIEQCVTDNLNYSSLLGLGGTKKSTHVTKIQDLQFPQKILHTYHRSTHIANPNGIKLRNPIEINSWKFCLRKHI